MGLGTFASLERAETESFCALRLFFSRVPNLGMPMLYHRRDNIFNPTNRSIGSSVIFAGRISRDTYPVTMARKPIDRGHIGANLKRIRETLGMSGDELAEAAGVGTATIRGIEAGLRRNPETATLEKLAKALGTTAAELQRKPDFTPIASLVPAMLKEYADVLAPLGVVDETHEAIQWLYSLDASIWFGCTPSPQTLFHFVRGYLARRK